jgi:hypothetical protein
LAGKKIEDLKNFLSENQSNFEIIHHKNPIYSSKDGVDYFGIEMGQTAPIIIIKTEKGFYALIVSGERGKIDLKIIAHLLGCSEIRLSTKKELKELNFLPGSIPLINHGFPCIFDKRLLRYKFVYGGTGFPDYTLKINPKDLERLNNIIAKIE